MSAIKLPDHDEGLTLRQAALIAGFGYLMMPVAFAEFAIYPKLVIPGNVVRPGRPMRVDAEVAGFHPAPASRLKVIDEEFLRRYLERFPSSL